MDIVQNLAQHYTDLLELQYPWVVEEIKTDHKNEKITIRVAYTKGEKPPCPVCKKPCIVVDHREGLLNYFTHRVTNAGTEGLNSRIQSIKARARGFRHFDNYRIAILFYLGKLDMHPVYMAPRKTEYLLLNLSNLCRIGYTLSPKSLPKVGTGLKSISGSGNLC